MNLKKKAGICIVFALLLTSCDLKVVEFQDSTSTTKSWQNDAQTILGAKATIEFIGNNAKLTVRSENGEENQTIVLTKIADASSSTDYMDVYKYAKNEHDVFYLKTSTFFSLVYSATFEYRENGLIRGSIQMQRKF